MNRKVYRFCLVVIIVAAVISGVWYYQFYQRQEINPKEGTLVWAETIGRKYV